jgi:hypothetical protein
LILNWRPKLEGERKPRKKRVVEPINAPPRSKKGKEKAAMEDDPIELFDDMYDNDDSMDLTRSTSLSIVNNRTSHVPFTAKTTTSFLLPPRGVSSSATQEIDPIESLYKKMLELRDEVCSFYIHFHKF